MKKKKGKRGKKPEKLGNPKVVGTKVLHRFQFANLAEQLI